MSDFKQNYKKRIIAISYKKTDRWYYKYCELTGEWPAKCYEWTDRYYEWTNEYDE